MDGVTLGILGAFAVAYILAYVRGAWDEERTRYSHRTLLRFTSVALVMLSFWGIYRLWDTPMQAYALLIAAGMSISFVGDLVTGGLIPSKKPYLVAVGVFGAGHLAYLAALWQASQTLQIPLGSAYLVAGLGVGAAVGIRLQQGGKTSLRLPAFGYALLLGTVLGVALTLAMAEARLIPLGVGAVLFSISDTLLGHRELRKSRWYLMNDVIWACYIFGQLGIVLSAAGWTV